MQYFVFLYISCNISEIWITFWTIWEMTGKPIYPGGGIVISYFKIVIVCHILTPSLVFHYLKNVGQERFFIVKKVTKNFDSLILLVEKS